MCLSFHCVLAFGYVSNKKKKYSFLSFTLDVVNGSFFFFYCHSCVDHSDCRSIFLEASDDVTVLVVPPRHLCVALE